MQPSGLMAKKLGPSTKQSIGQTSTQSVYLHWMQGSVTMNGMAGALNLGELRKQKALYAGYYVQGLQCCGAGGRTRTGTVCCTGRF